MLTRAVVLLFVFSTYTFASSPLDHLVPTKDKVKKELWEKGINNSRPMKIKDLLDYALPSEITVPLHQLED